MALTLEGRHGQGQGQGEGQGQGGKRSVKNVLALPTALRLSQEAEREVERRTAAALAATAAEEGEWTDKAVYQASQVGGRGAYCYDSLLLHVASYCFLLLLASPARV